MKMEEWIISKEDFENCFSKEKLIAEDNIRKYYIEKNLNFNAIFNATPRKSYKKRREMR